jgi:hypothetical protein
MAKKNLNADGLLNELKGGSSFFPTSKQTTNIAIEKKPESLKARMEESPNGRMDEVMKSGKPESQISGNQAIVNARKPENRKVPKYSTQLEEELQIQVSVFAKMHRMKDYEVVQFAIEEYLKSHK